MFEIRFSNVGVKQSNPIQPHPPIHYSNIRSIVPPPVGRLSHHRPLLLFPTRPRLLSVENTRHTLAPRNWVWLLIRIRSTWIISAEPRTAWYQEHRENNRQCLSTNSVQMLGLCCEKSLTVCIQVNKWVLICNFTLVIERIGGFKWTRQ